MNVVTYRTEHFEFRVPIDDWNKNKIPLPEGAGAKFIAPSDLTAILLKPFYYDWRYETDGRADKGLGGDKILVHGEEWVGEEIRHFSSCKEFFEFLEWLKKEYGWYIFFSWKSCYNAVQQNIASKQGIDPSQVTEEEVYTAFREDYKLGLSGRLAYKGKLDGVDKYGCFLSTRRCLAKKEHYCLYLDPGYAKTEMSHALSSAGSARCVSE